MMEWRPIETAPKDKTAVLVWSPSTHKVVRPARFWEYADQWIDEQSDKVLRPTHWMPLPEPPKDTAWIDQAAAHDFNDDS